MPSEPVRKLLALLLALILLAGCTPTPQAAPQLTTIPSSSPLIESPSIPSPQPSVQSPTAIAPTSTVVPTAADALPDALPIPEYQITAELSYDQHHLSAEEIITYYNRSADLLPNLVLMVDPLYYPGVFQLNRLEWASGKPVDDYRTEQGQIWIDLPEPLPSGQRIEMHLSYELSLPSPEPSPTTRPVPFGYNAYQTNLVEWYPFIPPYIAGEGWLAHPASYYGEYLAYDIANFDVRLRLLDARQDLIVAASAPELLEDGWRQYRLENARSFAFSVSHQYQVLSKTVGEVTVQSYAFPLYGIGNEAALNAAAESLELYSQLFGPYPRNLLSVVQAGFLDGMEYDGLFFLSKGFYDLYEGGPGNFLIAIAVHETAHQWWYGLVGNDQAQEPWLDEALCTYSERLYYEHLHPDALNWWWEVRVRFYAPQGWVDTTIYNPEGKVEAYLAYRDAVYLNGALFLEDLRSAIGDDAFYDFIKDYADQNQHQIATGRDFWELLGRHTSVDIRPLKSRYFSSN